MSAVAAIVLIVSKYMGQELLLPTWVWQSLFAIFLYVATYQVYSNALSNRPKTGKIELLFDSLRIGGGGAWSGSRPVPTEPTIAIQSEARNRAEENARLTKIEVEDQELGSAKFSLKPIELKVEGSPHKINLPWELEGKTIKRLHIQLPIKIAVESLEKYAEAVRDAKEFRVVLRYTYKNLDGEISQDTLEVSGNYSEFKDALLKQQLIPRSEHDRDLLPVLHVFLDTENKFKQSE